MPHRHFRSFCPVFVLAACSPTWAAAQGLSPLERDYSDGSTLSVYGQIDKGVLGYDDGIDGETYAPIDNDNSNTRFGLRYGRSFGAWKFENVNEFAYAPYSTSDINIIDQTPDASDWNFDKSEIRKIDFTLANDRYGKFWIGQGSMATDGVVEVDLSGTTVIAYSSVSASASAQILRFSAAGLTFDESLSGIEIGDVFANFDGDRRVRVRYDTRAFGGFTGAASYGRNLLSSSRTVRDQDLFDAAVRYGASLGDFEIAAGLGYYWRAHDPASWGGSASALHAPSGFNVTVAAGREDGDRAATFWYGKLGLKRDFLAWGTTAGSIDYYSGADFNLDESAGVTSSTSKSWGVAVVQGIDRVNTDLWFTWRRYDYADNSAGYENGTAIFGGARFHF